MMVEEMCSVSLSFVDKVRSMWLYINYHCIYLLFNNE